MTPAQRLANTLSIPEAEAVDALQASGIGNELERLTNARAMVELVKQDPAGTSLDAALLIGAELGA